MGTICSCTRSEQARIATAGTSCVCNVILKTKRFPSLWLQNDVVWCDVEMSYDTELGFTVHFKQAYYEVMRFGNIGLKCFYVDVFYANYNLLKVFDLACSFIDLVNASQCISSASLPGDEMPFQRLIACKCLCWKALMF